MPGLIKDSHTLSEQHLTTLDGKHQLYTLEWGSPNGLPIIYLHGGPGSGCSEGSKQVFNPQKHRVIFFDQRGSGNSLPYGSMEQNNTGKLVDDILQILDHFQIKKAVIYGRSWGSFLGLYFAILNPERVKSLVIGGIYLGEKSEHDWIIGGGFKVFYPDVWARLLSKTSEQHHANPVHYHQEQILNGSKESALVYSELILPILGLDDRVGNLDPETFDPTFIQIEQHYMSNNNFVDEGFILANASKLNMPVHIIHGRYDMLCPPTSAYRLHKAVPHSTLALTQGGHKSSDRSNYDVLSATLEHLS